MQTVNILFNFLNVYVLGVGESGLYMYICMYMYLHVCMCDVCNREMEIHIRHQYVISP